jgi:hypothetical protein
MSYFEYKSQKKTIMKTTVLKPIFYLLSVVIAFTIHSCSENDEITRSSNQNNFNLRNEGPGPHTPVIYEGLFDIELSNGVKANLLFEFPNTVIYGNATISAMMTQTTCKTTYITNSMGFDCFTISDGITTYNFKYQFNTVTGDLENGQFGIGIGYSNGTFTATKHMPEGAGETLFKGYWKGKYGLGVALPNSDYTMALEENGKFTVAANATIFGSSPSVGTYTLSGNIFKGTYTYLYGGQYSCKGTYDPATRKINGTWGTGLSYSNGGTFYLNMQNHL